MLKWSRKYPHSNGPLRACSNTIVFYNTLLVWFENFEETELMWNAKSIQYRLYTCGTVAGGWRGTVGEGHYCEGLYTRRNFRHETFQWVIVVRSRNFWPDIWKNDQPRRHPEFMKWNMGKPSEGQKSSNLVDTAVQYIHEASQIYAKCTTGTWGIKNQIRSDWSCTNTIFHFMDMQCSFPVWC